MPKRVDHQARRRQIAEALIDIVSREGMEAVNLRDVAAHAGVSMGAVQHYFKSKEDMLVHAAGHAADKVSDRIEEILRAEAGPTPRKVLRTVLIEMLPVSDEARSALLVHIAFLLRALNSPRLRSIYAKTWPKLVELFVDTLRTAERAGDLAPGTDPALEAELLLAVPDGLAASVLLGRRTGAEAVDVIDYHLDRIFRSG
ncbi:TetR/AcrR family transcriptional regulator [Saccharopolyspora taberi]|uniref:TetR/AcrR family transcriptional regulator n=1 Tax=Saccharopolyspora taberi TaxID=60895 RepID=A0ABN3VKN4_9PSEU